MICPSGIWTLGQGHVLKEQIEPNTLKLSLH